MSEMPEQTGPDSPEVDMLNEILDRATPSIPDPPEENFPAAQGPDVSRETSGAEKAEPKKPPSPPVQKNKRSSVYVYLAVLFGAAFLMLLLAYFVQQRNNATAMDDLRTTTTASRQELLEDIQKLEGENEALKEEKEQINTELARQEENFKLLEQTHDTMTRNYSALMERSALQSILSYLEQFNDAGDWLMSGMLIERFDFYFNEHNKEFDSQYLLPSQAARYLELREEVFDKGGCMVIESFTTTEDWSEYTERPYIGENIFEARDLEAASNLASAILYYPSIPTLSANRISKCFQPGSESLERLNSGAFRQSTVELFEQMRADLIAQNYLLESADGTLDTTIFYREGEPAADVSRETPKG